MFGYKDTSHVTKKAAEVAQKKQEELAHGEFRNESDKTTWMGHRFKTKSTKSKATFIK